MSDLEIRPVPEADLDRMINFADLVFHGRTADDEYERYRWLPRRSERIGTYAGDTLVGQLAAFPMRLSVPGALLDCSAVTYVGVLPTHRRRGVLTSMMERMHADAIAANRPVAALWASQSAIYGRYGFGNADRAIGLEIDTSRPLKLRTEPDPRPLRLIDREAAAEVIGPIHTRAIERRPGGLVRDAEWWLQNVLPSEDEEDDDLSEPRIAVMDGDPGGYAVYRTHHSGRGTVHLVDLEADTPQVEAALWRYLSEIDLTDRVKADSRPVDDLIPYMAADPDQVTVKSEYGALWIRLIDAPAALRARSWASADSLVIDLHDARLPANQGRWRLAAGACEQTGDAPDLTLNTTELAAAYLGGVSLRMLARLGVVTEHTPGAAERLDRAFSVPLAPYTNDGF
ncbi:GNAT family N-acetyltransferase [Actinomadura rubrisoli]|uniref:GNAT family N-acetyltransferase n=1 Tax=Actinomadura rubrisoli TaxID=2530368 RepID=A0A4R5B1V9_9ACTN|nr:GNAT family N-acetyltransferase [Actinomadura rubrisoli]TDD79003.1 GNAT family N-acetyltransferase [Actinomadura rubrisoli]